MCCSTYKNLDSRGNTQCLKMCCNISVLQAELDKKKIYVLVFTTFMFYSYATKTLAYTPIQNGMDLASFLWYALAWNSFIKLFCIILNCQCFVTHKYSTQICTYLFLHSCLLALSLCIGLFVLDHLHTHAGMGSHARALTHPRTQMCMHAPSAALLAPFATFPASTCIRSQAVPSALQVIIPFLALNAITLN